MKKQKNMIKAPRSYNYVTFKLVKHGVSMNSAGEGQHRAELHDRGVECGEDGEGFSVGVEPAEEVWDGRDADRAVSNQQAEQRQHEKSLCDRWPS